MKNSNEPKKVSGTDESNAHSAITDEASDVGESNADGQYDHIHDFADGLQDHELLYAHKHIGDKIAKNVNSKDGGKSKEMHPDISMDDFEKAKKED